MARIRTIKPEFLEDELIGQVSDEARLLSLSLLLLADDYGNGRANPIFIASKVWAYHEGSARKASLAMTELESIGFVRLYSVNGQSYFHIRNWDKHQRVDRPGKPLAPSIDEAEETEQSQGSIHFHAKDRVSAANVRESHATDLDLDLDHDQELNTSTSSPSPAEPVVSPVAAVFEHWRTTMGKDPNRTRLTRKRKSKITQRLKRFTVDELKEAIDRVAASDWHMDNGHNDLELICRSDDNVEKYRDLKPRASPPSSGTYALGKASGFAPAREAGTYGDEANLTIDEIFKTGTS